METTPGRRIQAWREYKGLSQTQMAKATGIKVTTLSSVEQDGGSKPSFDTLSKLQQTYPDLSPDWLLTGAGTMLRDGRNLTPLPKDPTPPTPTAGGLRVVEETAMEKQLKQENHELRKQLEFMRELMRTGGDFSKLGKQASFSLDNDEAATQPAYMVIAA